MAPESERRIEMNITPGKWTAVKLVGGNVRVDSADYIVCEMSGDESTLVQDIANACASRPCRS